MTSSLVGSEMCIRDRQNSVIVVVVSSLALVRGAWSEQGGCPGSRAIACGCLLYTSDAADDM
eukprot:25945-Prorocentrum_lima.AAC.1